MNFLDVQRPDIDSKQCPEGTSPCSTATRGDNRVCYPEADHAESCPITELRIVDYATGESLKNDSNYVVQEYRASEYLVYSKNVADNLPLTSLILDR